MRRAVVVLAVVVTACSSTRDATSTTLEATTTETSELPTTTSRSSTTSSTARSTSTSAPSTSAASSSTSATPTTVPPTATSAAASAAPLRRDGFSAVPFGTDAEAAIASVTAELGAPTGDTGWVEPISISTCPGTQARLVRWGLLSLLLGDESVHRQAAPHLVAWSYGTVDGVGGEPIGLLTEEDVGLGDTLADLRAAYPGVTVVPGEEGLLETGFAVDDALGGLLTGDTDADTVTVLTGGPYCG